MNRQKSFDCVEMKNALQAAMNQKQQGLSEEEIRKLSEEEFASSTSPIDELWRRLIARATAKT